MAGYLKQIQVSIVSFVSLFHLFHPTFSLQNNAKRHYSPLSNQHLTVAAKEIPLDFYVTRNSSGHIVKFDGVSWLTFEWLSAAHVNTTFNFIPFDPSITPLDASGGKPGLHDLLRNGEYDIITASLPTLSRTGIVDFTHPVAYIPVSYLIPSPHLSVNILSATKPFSTFVWIGLLVTFIIVIASVILVGAIENENKRRVCMETVFYVIGILFNQVISCRFNNKFSVRIIIATWSFASLIIINFYISLFISYLTIPITTSLINSIGEIQNHPEIWLVTDKNLSPASLLLSAESGLLKKLGDRIRADPTSLCSKSIQCVDLVKARKAAYTAGKDTFLLKELKNDYKATGKCNMEMGKENYMQLQIAWALQKKSPYLDPLNKSFMRMMEAGLILEKWYKERIPKIDECIPSTKMKRNKRAEVPAPLPLKGLLGVFVIFIVGSFFSLVVFIIETTIMEILFVHGNTKIQGRMSSSPSKHSSSAKPSCSKQPSSLLKRISLRKDPTKQSLSSTVRKPSSSMYPYSSMRATSPKNQPSSTKPSPLIKHSSLTGSSSSIKPSPQIKPTSSTKTPLSPKPFSAINTAE